MTWEPLATAPTDGTPLLWAGRWKPFDILEGGEWEKQIFMWSTLKSNGGGYQWIGPGFASPDHWNVDWKYWQYLPEDPED